MREVLRTTRTRFSFVLAASILAVLGCSGGGAAPPDVAEGTGDAFPGTAELPPRGAAAVRQWLAAGHYLMWTCEPAPHAARPPGAHGMTRVCSNAELAASISGDFPVGAASVKELHGSSGITGYALSARIDATAGAAGWYWFEVIGQSVVADGVGVGLCVNCHDGAPRDHVYTVVR